MMTPRSEGDLAPVDLPDAETQQVLLRAFLDSLPEVGETDSRYKQLLDKLFSFSLEAARQKPSRSVRGVSLQVLAEELKQTKQNLSATRSKLNRKLRTYFAGAGSRFAHRFEISENKFGVLFYANARPSDYVGLLWKPHRAAGSVRVYYPEPQFFKDRRDSYYRNHKVNQPDSKAAAAVFHLPVNELEPSQSFVPSGFVLALVRIFETLAGSGTKVSARRLRFGDHLSEDGSSVVLGTVSSVNALRSIAETFPIRSRRLADGTNVVTAAGHDYRDSSHRPKTRSLDLLNKWVVVTRVMGADGPITAFSGHGRAVDGATRLLTGVRVGESSADELLASVPQGLFAGNFQLLLRAQVAWAEGDLDLRRMFLAAYSSESGPVTLV
ncbi:MAG: hypothetical protein ABL982_18760, partial [Vicinamibacterales bacterium]